MSTDIQDLTSKQRELVAVGASIGAGCHPCVAHHLTAGAQAGLDGGQLLAAVASAERVSAEAALLMADHTRASLGSTVGPATTLTPLDDVFASFGAALGANDASAIDLQMRAALDFGASRLQLQQAIETAQKVQESATRIHLREAERLLDALKPEAAPASKVDSGDGCGCGAAKETAAACPEAQAPDPPSEASDTGDSDGATRPTSRCAGHSPDSSAGTGKMAGIAAAMANCRRTFAAGCRRPTASARMSESVATTASACSSKKEVPR